MRDNRRIQERIEVRLERPQLIWLTLGGVVALAAMFALGVVVGRRAARFEAGAPEGLAELDAQTDEHKQLTFYSKLTAPEQGGAIPADKPAVAKLAVAAPSAAAPAKAAPVVAARPAAAPPAAVTAPTSASEPVASAVASAVASKPAREASAPALSSALASGPARSGQYTVQVSSFQTLDEAKAYQSALERKGYRPFVVASHIAGKGTWYRVRLGSFDDEEQAREAKIVLARADIAAWVLKSE